MASIKGVCEPQRCKPTIFYVHKKSRTTMPKVAMFLEAMYDHFETRGKGTLLVDDRFRMASLIALFA